MERSRPAPRPSENEAPRPLNAAPPSRSQEEVRAPEKSRLRRLEHRSFQVGLALPVLVACVESALLIDVEAGTTHRTGAAARLITLSLCTTLLPLLPALWGAWRRSRLWNALGVWPLGLAGLALMAFCLVAYGSSPPPAALLAFCLGAARLLSALCLRLPKGGA